MNNQINNYSGVKKQIGLKNFLSQEKVSEKIESVLGKNKEAFVSTLVSIANSNNLLSEAVPSTIVGAALTAATLNLPIEPSLGFAYIVPYKKNNVPEAQFQIGYKGLIQLALRSGQFKNLNSGAIYEEQFVSYNPLFEELEIDFTKPVKTTTPIGYFASMKLLNGFEKVVYWTKKQVEIHRNKFSKSSSRANSPWNSEFDAMAQKTVMKSMLSKYAPMSIEMQDAIVEDNKTEEFKEINAEVVDSQAVTANNVLENLNIQEVQGETVKKQPQKIEEVSVGNQFIEIEDRELPF